MSPLRSQLTLTVRGMTCAQCQKKIAAALRGAPGVLAAEVSWQKGTASVTYDADRITEQEIITVIERLGYRAGRADKAASLPRTAALLALIFGLAFLLQRFGLLNFLVPSQLAGAGMGYAALFLVGMLTSVHCVAMCGGIGLSQCLPRAAQAPGAPGTLRALAPALLYNLGRVVSYTLVGALMGLAGMVLGGGALALSPLLAGVLKLLAGLLMAVMWINMLGLLPWLRRFQPRLPRWFAASCGARQGAGRAPFLVGLLNGLMPCGPLQAMQVAALASGSPLAGALSMLAFSLGTVPLMLGLGSLAAALGQKFARQVMAAGAVLVAVLGLAMAAQGVSLAGLLPQRALGGALLLLGLLAVLSAAPLRPRAVKLAALTAVLVLGAGLLGLLTLRAPAAGGQGAAAQIEDGVQVVCSTLDPRRYPSITVQAGVPVRWVIDAPAGSVNGCNYRMELSPFGQAVELHEGENVIEFTPAAGGSFDYSCWMGMVWGNVTVTGPDGAAPPAAVPAAAQKSGGCPMCAARPRPTAP